MAYDGFYSDLSTRGTSSDLLTQAKSVSAEIVDLASSVLLNTERVLASANQANSSAVNSKNSADLAKVSELAAAVSAANAKSSELIVTTSVSPYLGASATVPTVRRDGSPLQVGDTYLNTATGLEYIYRSGAWVVRNLDGALLSGPTGSSLIGRNMPILTKMSDLLAYPKTSTAKQVYLSGYYTHGDVNIGVYSLDEADTTSISNGGTIVVATDGGRWKLSPSGPLSVKMFGARGNGVADDSVAMISAHATGSNIYYPAGTYLCSQQVVVVGAFGLLGDGVNKTIIKFNGSTQGFKVTQNNTTQGIKARCASIQTTTSVSTTVGFLVDGTPQLAGSDGAGHSVIQDRTSIRAYLEELDFRGSTDSAGWGINLQLKSVMNFSVDKISIRGSIPAVVGNLTGIGILINGDGVPVDFSVRRVWAYYVAYGILMPDYIEGGHIYDCEFVAVSYGIVGQYQASYSVLPQSATGCLAMYLDQIHINAVVRGIYLINTNQTHIKGCNIYLQPLASTPNAIGVHLTNGSHNQISDTFVNGGLALNTRSNNSSIILSQCDSSTAVDIKAVDLLSAVSLVGSTNCEVKGVMAKSCTFAINGDGPSVRNKLSAKGVSLSSLIYNVAPDNNLVLEEYSTTLIQTFVGQTTFNLSVVIPIGTLSARPIFASIVSDGGPIAYNFQYDYDGSTSTLAKFTITPASPATTLPNGGVRFSVSVRGI